ncbi:MAG: hypothetical protein Q7U91_12485 [Sideroxyarcus sp.]|nr:hypothetical protein [Sideroxyarcus sp.]
MKKLLCSAAALCVLLLSGCASNQMFFQPIMDSSQSPASDSGYVAGMFSRDWNPARSGFGLGIVNTATAEEYVMPFGVETGMPHSVTDAFGMIQLPPGEYRVASWLMYSPKDAEILSQTDISPDSRAGLPFTLAPGEAVFIGSHVAKYGLSTDSDGNKTWSVSLQQLALPTVQKALAKKYPEFVTQPLSCPSCLK